MRLLFCVLYTHCAILSAQTTNMGSLMGKIADQSGSVVRGAVVRLSSQSTGLTRTVTTGEAGGYRIDLLPAGVYAVDFSMPNFTTVVIGNVGVAVNQTTSLDAVLTPAGQRSSVTVEASGAAVVDVQSSDVRLLVRQ